MSNQPTSLLRLRSLGIVLVNRNRDSWYITVDPIEEFPMDSGEVSEDSKSLEVDLPTLSGLKKKTSLTGGSAIKAKWYPDCVPHLATPPDVCVGETVKIWQFGDDPELFWTTAMFEPGLRRLERVRYMFSNLSSGTDAFDEKTSYYLEFSTFDKRVRIVTNDNDGEAAAYDLTFDTKAGTFALQDNLGNNVELNSVLGELKTNVENLVEVNTKTYRVNAETIELNAKETTMNSGTLEMKSNSMSVSSETPAKMKCDMDMVGEMKLKGHLDVDGDIDSTGKIIDKGGNTPNHSH